MIIAQLSDLHCTVPGERAVKRFDSNAALARAVARVNGLRPRPDLVVVTGDIGNGPKPGEYGPAAELLGRLEVPFLPLPGNHDDRQGLREAFGHLGLFPAEGEFLHYEHRAGGLRILALDTVIPRDVPGLLCDARLAWVEARLREDTGPTLVIMHHPPFLVGSGIMDPIRCQGGEALERLLRRHGNIVGVLCGHVHRAIAVPYAGTLGFCAPSTAMLLAFDPTPGAPPVWTDDPPGFALHVWEPGEPLRSHVLTV